MGGTEHSPELRAYPPRRSARTKLCAASRLGRRCPPRLRTSRDAPAGGEGCRLRCGGLAVGSVWLIPAPVWQISGQRNASRVTACARDERKFWSDAPSGLLCRCGRLHLAGTKGIQVFSDTARRRHSVGWCHVPWPVSIRARSKPHPTSTARRSRVALHRQAHPGNLRHPACRLRTSCKISARSRPLTRDRYAPPARSIHILKGEAPTKYETVINLKCSVSTCRPRCSYATDESNE